MKGDDAQIIFGTNSTNVVRSRCFLSLEVTSALALTLKKLTRGNHRNYQPVGDVQTGRTHSVTANSLKSNWTNRPSIINTDVLTVGHFSTTTQKVTDTF